VTVASGGTGYALKVYPAGTGKGSEDRPEDPLRAHIRDASTLRIAGTRTMTIDLITRRDGALNSGATTPF